MLITRPEGFRYPKTILLSSWAYMHFGLGLEFFWDLLIEEIQYFLTLQPSAYDPFGILYITFYG